MQSEIKDTLYILLLQRYPIRKGLYHQMSQLLQEANHNAFCIIYLLSNSNVLSEELFFEMKFAQLHMVALNIIVLVNIINPK